jgi:transposase
LQTSWTTWSASTRTATRMRSRSCTPAGAALFEVQVRASERGYAQALRLAEREAAGRRAWAIEGTGSYGAGLTRFLSARGERVLEVGRTRRERRSQAKTDAIDALRAARSVLGTVQLASPRAAGEREALRALMVARAGALAAKKAGLCQLRALLVTCPSRCAANCAHSRARGCSVAWRRCARTGTRTRSCAAR